MAENIMPSFFHMRARLPQVGRTNQVLGASPQMTAVLKTYASGGALYSLAATEGVPLVMLRAGAIVEHDKDLVDRIDQEDEPFDGYSDKNKEVPYVLEEHKLFE